MVLIADACVLEACKACSDASDHTRVSVYVCAASTISSSLFTHHSSHIHAAPLAQVMTSCVGTSLTMGVIALFLRAYALVSGY